MDDTERFLCPTNIMFSNVEMEFLFHPVCSHFPRVTSRNSPNASTSVQCSSSLVTSVSILYPHSHPFLPQAASCPAGFLRLPSESGAQSMSRPTPPG